MTTFAAFRIGMKSIHYLSFLGVGLLGSPLFVLHKIKEPRSYTPITFSVSLERGLLFPFLYCKGSNNFDAKQGIYSL